MKKRLSPLLSETKRKFSSPKLKKERNHWIDASNQRIFLIEFAKKHDIQQPSDWGKFSTQDLKEEGGSGVLKRHKNSLVRTLQEVFTGDKLQLFTIRNKMGIILVRTSSFIILANNRKSSDFFQLS